MPWILSLNFGETDPKGTYYRTENGMTDNILEWNTKNCWGFHQRAQQRRRMSGKVSKTEDNVTRMDKGIPTLCRRHWGQGLYFSNVPRPSVFDELDLYLWQACLNKTWKKWSVEITTITINTKCPPHPPLGNMEKKSYYFQNKILLGQGRIISFKYLLLEHT